jgi:hypothetical protein
MSSSNWAEGGARAAPDCACFAANTRILTPDGDVPVQNLAPGDEVLTLRGSSDAVMRIIWAGRRSIDLWRHPRPDKVMPIRFIAGALGIGLPEHDLLLSPDHCLFIGGHLIEAKILVNGATVIQDESFRHITYHHIELEQHDVVLAEGVPVETFLDKGNRRMFDGAPAPMLHPDFAPATRLSACAPLALDGPIVHTARQDLLERAHTLGFAVTNEGDLLVKAGIEKLLPERGSLPDRMLFELTQPYASVELLSSTGVPAHTGADPDDSRRLGVAVTRLTLLTGDGAIEIALDDPAHRGFHDPEGAHRWTNGAARIALPAYTGRAILEVSVKGHAARWAPAPKTSAVSA